MGRGGSRKSGCRLQRCTINVLYVFLTVWLLKPVIYNVVLCTYCCTTYYLTVLGLFSIALVTSAQRNERTTKTL